MEEYKQHIIKDWPLIEQSLALNMNDLLKHQARLEEAILCLAGTNNALYLDKINSILNKN